MIVSTEDLQPQLTGRTKHSAAFGILLPRCCPEGAAQSQGNNLQLNGKHPAQMGVWGGFQTTVP